MTAFLADLVFATALLAALAWLSHRPRFDSLVTYLAAALPRKGLTP